MLFQDSRILFIDTAPLESFASTSLRLNSPEKRGPCLLVEKEWELGGARPCSVVEWEGQYRFYYKVNPAEDLIAAAFVVSSDGITWHRPDLGAVDFNGSRANNLVDIQNEKTGETCVFVDPSAPDEHRFKMVCHTQEQGGAFLMTSPDGVRFQRIAGRLLDFIVDNHISGFYDPTVGKYRLYMRGWDRARALPPLEGTRMVVLAETDDLLKPLPIDENAPDPWPPARKWMESEWAGMRRVNKELPCVMKCDELDPPSAGLYQAAAVHYTPDTYVAFPSLYYSYPWPPEGEFINDGVLDLQFASSRDGVHWNRDIRDPYVRLDLPDGDCTKMMHMLQGMVPNGYRLSQYYVGGNRTHGQGRTDGTVKVRHDTQMGNPIIRRLEQRMDGFMSADSAYTGGSLVTKPFTLRSASLKLNIDTSASGDARAALLNPDGSAVEGHSLADCDRIQGNDTGMEVTWKGSADLSRLRGRSVKLVLESRASRLYAVYP